MRDRKENGEERTGREGFGLFDTLVWTVIGYGTEIWGWKERKVVKRVYETYLKDI